MAHVMVSAEILHKEVKTAALPTPFLRDYCVNVNSSVADVCVT